MGTQMAEDTAFSRDMCANGVVTNEMLTRTMPFRSVTKVSKVAPTYNGVSMAAPGMLELCFSTTSTVC